MQGRRSHGEKHEHAGSHLVVCPQCGRENTADAVFCANPACHKALGDFRYAEEEIAREALRLGAAKLSVRTRFVQRIAE